MNPSTVPALTTALVWSDMHDVMLARTPYRFKLHISAKIIKAQIVKNQETIKHLAYLLTRQRNSTQYTHFGIDVDVHVWIEFSTGYLTGSTGCSDFFIKKNKKRIN